MKKNFAFFQRIGCNVNTLTIVNQIYFINILAFITTNIINLFHIK
jgi:hypothetical protein